MTHPKIPCRACPFRRDVIPGALGGSPPEVFLGQAVANMWLPCHSAYTPGVSAKAQDANVCPQCAGAAIFRANIGVPQQPGIHSLPPDDRVFPTAAHFLAHHGRMTFAEARALTSPERLAALAVRELTSASVRVQAVRSGG